MHFVINEIFAKDKRGYVHDKLALIARRCRYAADPKENVEHALAGEKAPAIDIVPPGDHPACSNVETVEIEARKRCAQMDLLALFPLIEREVLENDTFSYLRHAYGDRPAGTVVLVRTTNLSRTTLFFDDIRIEGSELILPPESESRRPHSLSVKEFVIDDIALAIASKIAATIGAKIGEKIGNKILGSLFDPEVPSYFNKVYAHLKQLFGEEVRGDFISIMNGHVKGFTIWLNDSFLPARESGTAAKDLLVPLDQWQIKFASDVLGPLETENFRRAGLPTYMLASSIILMLDTLQAEIDAGGGDVLKSHYTRTRELHAARFAKHVESTYSAMQTDIKNSVRIEDHTSPAEQVCTPNGLCHIAKPVAAFTTVDSWGDADVKYGPYYDDKKVSARQKAQDKLDGILNPRLNTVKSSVGGKEPLEPDSISGDWRKLAGYVPS